MNAFSRNYVSEIRRSEEMERRLRKCNLLSWVFAAPRLERTHNTFLIIKYQVTELCSGFFAGEIEREKLPVPADYKVPQAPNPKDLIDLEVKNQ